MRRLLTATIVLCIILIAVWYFLLETWAGLGTTTPFRSNVDGQTYLVHSGHSDLGDASDTLAVLNLRTIELLRNLKKKYGGGEKGVGTRRQVAVGLIREKYNPDAISENSPIDGNGDTSYTINKGEQLTLCIRDASGDRRFGIQDINTLTFVTIHELAHIGTRPEADAHSRTFWSTFKFLLQEASDSGIYDPVDYSQRPVKYCGIGVNYNPLYDTSVTSL